MEAIRWSNSCHKRGVGRLNGFGELIWVRRKSRDRVRQRPLCHLLVAAVPVGGCGESSDTPSSLIRLNCDLVDDELVDDLVSFDNCDLEKFHATWSWVPNEHLTPGVHSIWLHLLHIGVRSPMT